MTVFAALSECEKQMGNSAEEYRQLLESEREQVNELKTALKACEERVQGYAEYYEVTKKERDAYRQEKLEAEKRVAELKDDRKRRVARAAKGLIILEGIRKDFHKLYDAYTTLLLRNERLVEIARLYCYHHVDCPRHYEGGEPCACGYEELMEVALKEEDKPCLER